jgi:hypothetical protein
VKWTYSAQDTGPMAESCQQFSLKTIFLKDGEVFSRLPIVRLLDYIIVLWFLI